MREHYLTACPSLDNEMEQKYHVSAGIHDAGTISSTSGGPVMSML